MNKLYSKHYFEFCADVTSASRFMKYDEILGNCKYTSNAIELFHMRGFHMRNQKMVKNCLQKCTDTQQTRLLLFNNGIGDFC